MARRTGPSRRRGEEPGQRQSLLFPELEPPDAAPTRGTGDADDTPRSAANIRRVGACPVYVGTGGYHYDHWVGPFYPPGLPKSRMLDFYCRRFPAVEVNSTYYGIPRPALIERLAEDTPDGFRVSIKAYRGITHEFEGDGVFARFAAPLRPLAEAGKLAALLLQFPNAFRNVPSNRDFVSRCADRLGGPCPVAVEFRSDSWDRPEILDWLARQGLCLCSPDVPDLAGLMPWRPVVTGPVGYCRLHSRNAANWYAGAEARYDYLYSPDELRRIADDVAAMCGSGPSDSPSGLAPREVLVFFNNCVSSQAADNAGAMLGMLGSERTLDGPKATWCGMAVPRGRP